MSNYDAHRAWFAGTTAELPAAHPPPTRDEQRRLDDERYAAAAKYARENPDGPTGETDTFILEDALIGGYKRDQYGEIVRDVAGNPLKWDYRAEVPQELPAGAVEAMLGQRRADEYAAPEPTPTQIFEQQAREAEQARWTQTIRDRFDAALKAKEQD